MRVTRSGRERQDASVATFRLRQHAPGRVELRASPVSALLGTVMMTGFGVVLLV